jgi:replication factor C subunit 3/5
MDTVYDVAAAPRPSDIDRILKSLMSSEGFNSCVGVFKTVKSDRGVDLAEIVTALAKKLQKMNVPANVKIVWLQGLAEIEWLLRCGASEEIQIGASIGVVRRGKLLIGRSDFSKMSLTE